MKQLFRKNLARHRKEGSERRLFGFTLVEVILASTIFTIVSLIGVMVFINVTRMQRRVALENAIFEDGRFMMERIDREIRSNTIDYEEYYNKLSLAANPYGSNYGCYASRFYNPGTAGPHDGELGAYCSTSPPYTVSVETDPNCIYDKATLDTNTGQNPYQGSLIPFDEATDANAFCDPQYPPQGGSCTIGPHLHARDELYLIDPAGKQKTIFALKKFNDKPNDEFALSMLRIKGQDGNLDGINEIWTGMQCATPFCCAEGYDCAGPGFTSLEDSLDGVTNGIFKGFVPISPLRTKIVSLKFYVSPLEDPRRAFNETALDDGIQQQPHVTVVMVLQPAESELANFSGDIPTVTLQTTISSRIYNEVKSYGNQSVCEMY